MKIIEPENLLCLTTDDLLKSGIDLNTALVGKSRGSKIWQSVNDPSDKRNVLFLYEEMSDKYKKLIQDQFGKNPYEYVAKLPIKKLVETDFAANSFFLSHEYDGNKKLPLEHVKAYTVAASWLNMIIKCNDDKKFVKQEVKLSIADFYKNVIEIIEAEKIELPTSYKRLREKMKSYQEKSYLSLIDWRFGRSDNNNNAKIKDELSQSVLQKLVSTPYVDDVTVTRGYNNWALLNGRKTISHATVGNFRRDNEPMFLNEKEGSKAWFDTYGKIIKRRRASCPLACCEHDDNDLDLYFIKNKLDKKGNSVVFYYGRFVVAVVMDTFNDYILGWAMAEVYTKDLIKLAYLDAIYHIKELTGGYYLPHQIRSDRFGLDVKLTNDLAVFYKSIATYTPAKAKSARGKYIEQSFGKKWHQILCHYKNYAGHNIQSKAGINNELIETNKRIFPNETQAPIEIAAFIDKLRNLQQIENGPSKQDVWIAAFNQSEISQQNKIDDEQMLCLFGTTHTFKNQIGDNKVQITSRGIEITINKQFHEFDIADEIYMQVVGKRVHVVYEPYNLNRVLITDGNTLRFIAYKLTEEMKMPSALIDYLPGDRSKLNNRLKAMTDHVKMFTDKKNKVESILQLNKIDTEGILQSGLLIKGIKQSAELSYQNNLLNNGNVIDNALNGM